MLPALASVERDSRDDVLERPLDPSSYNIVRMDRVHRHDWLAGFVNEPNGPVSKRMKAGVAAPYRTRSREFNQRRDLLACRAPPEQNQTCEKYCRNLLQTQTTP